MTIIYRHYRFDRESGDLPGHSPPEQTEHAGSKKARLRFSRSEVRGMTLCRG